MLPTGRRPGNQLQVSCRSCSWVASRVTSSHISATCFQLSDHSLVNFYGIYYEKQRNNNLGGIGSPFNPWMAPQVLEKRSHEGSIRRMRSVTRCQRTNSSPIKTGSELLFCLVADEHLCLLSSFHSTNALCPVHITQTHSRSHVPFEHFLLASLQRQQRIRISKVVKSSLQFAEFRII